MKRILTLAALLALTGCATVQDFSERHPVATTVIAGVVVTSLVLTANKHFKNTLVDQPQVSNPLVACEPVESCK